MALNLDDIQKNTGLDVSSTDALTWSIGRKKTLETLKLDWIKLIRKEIKRIDKGKSRMVRWTDDKWSIRLIKTTVALNFGENEVLLVDDRNNCNEVVVNVLTQIIEQIKKGNLNKEIQLHMDKCRLKRDKYKVD